MTLNFKIEEKMEALNLSSIRLKRLFDNLLTWSKSQQKSINFNPISLNVKEIIEYHLHLLKDNILEKKLKITYKIEDNIFIYVDKYMFSTVIKNLIINAIKFTSEEKEIKIYTEIKEKNILHLTFEDKGIGIAKRDIDKLFRIDIQYQKLGTNKEKGSGLGLIICKEFLEKNNGKIYVESKLNEGSKFIVELALKTS